MTVRGNYGGWIENSGRRNRVADGGAAAQPLLVHLGQHWHEGVDLGPWRTLEQVELATAQWVDWYNQRRLHSSIGNLPPAEYEAAYYAERDGSAVA